MHILVLGAGIIGTTTAWFLRKAGYDVTVVDRQHAPAMETSFANGGQISVSHVEPWANPNAPGQILKWLGQEDAPLLFRFRLDPAEWLWGARFLLECLPGMTRENMQQIFAISRYSGETLRELRAETGIVYDQVTRGILHLYTEPAGFGLAREAAALVQSMGIARRVVSREECVAIEPALAAQGARIVGGTYTQSDESGDAHLFAQALAKLAEARGVRFRFGLEIERLVMGGRKLLGVDARDVQGEVERLEADAYVVALGSYSPRLLFPVGVPCLVYPLKGYSVTLPIRDASKAPTVSLTDDARKIVFSRLGNRLRAAGTAELNGYDLALNPVRCQALTDCAAGWFGDAVDAAGAVYWAGLRPATPSNVPLIGATRYANLYLNTGHGTLGWTMSCGSGRALAELIAGRPPDIGFRFLAP
jgi:D-amino-acid dehydrogenase